MHIHASPTHENQEVQEGRDSCCATLCFDHAGSELMNRVSQVVYEQGRTGGLQLSGFPNFDPLLTALREGTTADRSKSYRVSTQRHDQLVLLETYTKKWFEDPNFEDRARAIVKSHNEEFNPVGDMVMAERLG